MKPNKETSNRNKETSRIDKLSTIVFTENDNSVSLDKEINNEIVDKEISNDTTKLDSSSSISDLTYFSKYNSNTTNNTTTNTITTDNITTDTNITSSNGWSLRKRLEFFRRTLGDTLPLNDYLSHIIDVCRREFDEYLLKIHTRSRSYFIYLASEFRRECVSTLEKFTAEALSSKFHLETEWGQKYLRRVVMKTRCRFREMMVTDIAHLIKERGLTQSDIATITGTHQSVVSVILKKSV